MDELFQTIANYQEDNKTAKLMAELSLARQRGYLTKNEFLKIAMWKSRRPKKQYLKNQVQDIEEITKAAFTMNNERIKIIILTALRGISIPAASAVLTLVYPDKYGVIDIRVWQALHRLGYVKTNSKGRGLTIENWLEYLTIIRNLAEQYNTTPRASEQILFHYHRSNIQDGNLYKGVVTSRGIEPRLLG
jgi:thermostable 8-oxoguanine DNA glycosylase